jgi:hypothetical protein
MTSPSALAAWPGVVIAACLLSALGNGCSSSLKANSDGSAGAAGGAGAGGAGSGGRATGGSSSGGSGGRATGGAGAGGSGGDATGGGGGSASLDGGIPCPVDAGAAPFLFCVDDELYEGRTLCSPGGGECACLSSVLRHCDYGCVRDTQSGAAACASPDAGQPDTPTPTDALKLDALTMDPPDGANLHPVCAPGKNFGFRSEFCYDNGLFSSALACPAPAGSPCSCVSMFQAYCASRCVELPDETAECQ